MLRSRQFFNNGWCDVSTLYHSCGKSLYNQFQNDFCGSHHIKHVYWGFQWIFIKEDEHKNGGDVPVKVPKAVNLNPKCQRFARAILITQCNSIMKRRFPESTLTDNDLQVGKRRNPFSISEPLSTTLSWIIRSRRTFHCQESQQPSLSYTYECNGCFWQQAKESLVILVLIYCEARSLNYHILGSKQEGHAETTYSSVRIPTTKIPSNQKAALTTYLSQRNQKLCQPTRALSRVGSGPPYIRGETNHI